MLEKIGPRARGTVTLAWMVACAAGFVASQAAAELVNENLLVAVPDGYKIDFRARKNGMLINEMVPAAESVHGWTEMVTVQIFYNFKAGLEDFRAQSEKFWAGACPGSRFNTVAKATENGYPALIWLQSCPLNKATGKPEITWFKAIKGHDSLYVVQKAFKFMPTKEQIGTWMQYLKKVAVCDSRLLDRACPATKQ